MGYSEILIWLSVFLSCPFAMYWARAYQRVEGEKRIIVLLHPFWFISLRHEPSIKLEASRAVLLFSAITICLILALFTY